MSENRTNVYRLPTCYLFIVMCLAFVYAQKALAFPEMIRSGYTNCTTCHVSPNGGGILTDYGRNLSSEVLSTWGSAREAQPLHGLFGAKDEDKQSVDHWLGVGGDVRAVQTRLDNVYVRSGHFYWMQAMLDLAYQTGTWTGMISIGKFSLSGDNSWRPDSERFYIMKGLTDTMSVRAGRFVPSFGLNIPDHISPTRGGAQPGTGLGFGISQERDTVEFDYIGENWNAAAGYAEGPRDNISALEQSGFFQLQRAFREHYKIGISAWHGKRKNDTRQIFGLHGMFGFTSHFYLLSEIDAQFLHPNASVGAGSDHVGYFGYHKLGYEFHKGMHAFALLMHSQADARDDKQFSRRWGGGLQFFPRPHFEISGVWTKDLLQAPSRLESDYAWLLLHYYI